MKHIEDNLVGVSYVSGRFLLSMYGGPSGMSASIELTRSWVNFLKRRLDEVIAAHDCECEAQALSQANALPLDAPTVAEVRGEQP